jgi:1-phosphofructokinase
MVYTITLNPALDYNISLEEFNLGKLNLTDKAYFLGGGKGINVSKVLKNLDTSSKALGFLGGFTGEFIKSELKERGIEEEFVEVEGDTRVNLKIKNGEVETEIAGISPKITDSNLQELFDKLHKIEEDDILVLSGSVPKSLEADIYKKVIKNIPEKTRVILDTRGDAFKKSLEAKPYLVKPNIHELEEFCGRTFENLDEVVEGAREIMGLGAQNVIVSMGGDGSMLVTPTDVYRGNVPKGTLRNSVGAGDSMVGGIVAKLAAGSQLVDAYKFGIGAGSATAFSYDLCTLDEINLLLKEIEVSKY